MEISQIDSYMFDQLNNPDQPVGLEAGVGYQGQAAPAASTFQFLSSSSRMQTREYQPT
jgi:hypothetical protein